MLNKILITVTLASALALQGLSIYLIIN